MRRKKFFYILLLFCPTFWYPTIISKDPLPLPIPSHKHDHIAILQALLSRVLQQINHIKLRLEQITRSFKTRTFKSSKHRKLREKELRQLQLQFTYEIRNQYLTMLNEQELLKLIESNKKFITRLYHLIDYDEGDLAPFEGIRSSPFDISIKNLNKAIEANEKALKRLGFLLQKK